MIISNSINNSLKNMYFVKISRENRHEASRKARRQNAPYEVTGKEARNVCLIGKFLKWLYERANHVINHMYHFIENINWYAFPVT